MHNKNRSHRSKRAGLHLRLVPSERFKPYAESSGNMLICHLGTYQILIVSKGLLRGLTGYTPMPVPVKKRGRPHLSAATVDKVRVSLRRTSDLERRKNGFYFGRVQTNRVNAAGRHQILALKWSACINVYQKKGSREDTWTRHELRRYRFYIFKCPTNVDEMIC